ncbi:MAG: glycosyltransferase [Verrucomicrobia bacterium]|nr:MAG: glycosyltransferase [Verrucomicrobiota bacterium]
MPPKVSICLPVRNAAPFLAERIASIKAQTLTDWEVVALDGFSDDGSWEQILAWASCDPRVRALQEPPAGIYPAFNRCIEMATGPFIYIATADDTMAPDCLDKMVAALEAHPDCGLCQCRLQIIDEQSTPYPGQHQWNHYTLGIYDQALVQRRNLRRAPHDGLLHPALFTVYTSVTQLLIRRAVFTRVGLFDGRWGSISDFEWGMRTGLMENCIYIPDMLATWRQHGRQATQDVHSPAARVKMIEMSQNAFNRTRDIGPPLLAKIDAKAFTAFLEKDLLELTCQSASSQRTCLVYLLGQLLFHPRWVITCVITRLRRHSWGYWANEIRYKDLRRLLVKVHAPQPEFL